MATHSSKRRKLEHVSSNEEDDEASFASFGSDDEDVEENGRMPPELEAGANNGSDSEDVDMGDDNGNDIRHEDAQDAVPKQIATPSAQRPTKRATNVQPSTGAYPAGTFKSSLFKLQADELLEQIRPRHGSREKEAEAALHKIKSAIDAIPVRPPTSVDEAERRLLTKSKIVTPFPDPKPPKDAKYKLEYSRPANVNVVGSYTLKTRSRANKILEIDMAVTIPFELFQEKDYLNHRYFYKRAYYLACLAEGLQNDKTFTYDLRFGHFRGNRLHPVIEVTPKSSDNQEKALLKWKINIMPCIAEDVFDPDKLVPSRCSLRQQTDNDTTKPTPFYNSSLRADMLATSYLKLQHNMAKTCEAFKDACLFGSTWLRQRGLESDIPSGGFGAFEWCAVISLLLQGGGAGGRPILSDRYSSYQLLKATLQMVVTRDLRKQPLTVGAEKTASKLTASGIPVLWDAERKHNILYKMSSWSYKVLQQQAKITLQMLGDQTFDGFEASFILRIDNQLYSYDYVIELHSGTLGPGSMDSDATAMGTQQKLHNVLQQGLGDRARLINILPPRLEAWPAHHARPRDANGRKMRVAICVNPETVNRAVDHGPSAEKKDLAASFREFWGEKAELRRFKDGSILETLVWDAKNGSVLEQIVRYLLHRHFGGSISEAVEFIGDSVKRLLPSGEGTAAGSGFAALNESFRRLESDIRGLDGLPLSVRQISAAAPQLRSASVEIPGRSISSKPADVVLQFEGSARWPDDLLAIQRTKIAFLLKLSEQLTESAAGMHSQIGLENEDHDILNQGFLDVVYDAGAAFRIRIHHDREQTLLERRLKDKTLAPSLKDAAVLGLAAYKRDYMKSPAHTQAFAGLCSRNPALSGTVRLLKHWFASHLLTNHIADEVIELTAARSFVQPWPWQAPSSVQTGFYRTLSWLSRWDWKNEPLIVDLSGSGELKPADHRSIATKFEAWRKLDPALNRVVFFAASNVDPDGTTWTDGRPTKVVAGRMTALAKAARAEIEDRGLALDPATIFSSPLSDFDFALHLDPTVTGGKRRKKHRANGHTAFKNLELDISEGPATVGFDPLHDFVGELERLYGSAMLLFSGGTPQSVIAGLWNPQTASRTWTLNLSHSTIPVKLPDQEKIQALVNKDAILAEIAQLGSGIVQKIEVHRH